MTFKKAAPGNKSNGEFRGVMVKNEVQDMTEEEVQAKLADQWQDDFGITGEVDNSKDDGFETRNFKTYACDIKDVTTLDKTLPLPLNVKLYLKYLKSEVVTSKNKDITTQIKRRGKSTREALYNKSGDSLQILHIFVTRSNQTIGIWGNGTLNYQLIEDVDTSSDPIEIDTKLPEGLEVCIIYKGKDGTGQMARHDIEVRFPKEFLQSTQNRSSTSRIRRVCGVLVGENPKALTQPQAALTAEASPN